MPVVSEVQLKANIQSGKFSTVYFLYGEESFLVKTYADKIKNKAIGDNQTDINLLELSGNPDLSVLSDHVEALPFFADYKVIMINDFNPEKVDESDTEAFLRLLKNVPDTTVIVFYLTGCSFSLRTSRIKKLFEEIKGLACVCEFKQLNKMKIGDIIAHKVKKEKKLISATNAEYLAEITGCDLNLASMESSKLCSYVKEGQEITREIIDKMVEKKLETKVFTLSDAMLSGNVKRSMEILSELQQQRVEPIAVIATLSSVYSEYYADKSAYNEGVTSGQAASDLGFTGGKAAYAAKKYNAASRMNIDKLRRAEEIIFNADVKLKSAKIDGNILLEETVLKLIRLGI
ncbi:MAG: DNA polymerase III subunit delta [Firmicutes bacterium]|nr:DNA polymerase III subunit delta [[Eubacterium] siraeum]MCM1487344.1 DNA polymerase III subunit delta [Bacillota bacterium]